MRLYISHRCFLCRWLEPIAARLARLAGVRLTIWKLHPDGWAHQVNGPGRHWAGDIPAVPTLIAGRVVVVGLPALLARMTRR